MSQTSYTRGRDRGGAGPHEAPMVGDSLRRDIAGAHAAGLRGIWLNRRGMDPDPAISPDATISTLAALRGALKALS